MIEAVLDPTRSTAETSVIGMGLAISVTLDCPSISTRRNKAQAVTLGESVVEREVREGRVEDFVASSSLGGA